VIAIDLGSNSLRVLAYDCDTNRMVGSYEKSVKTADGLAQTGRISSEAVSRIVTVLKEAQNRFDFSTSVYAVTTQALRKASNQKEVLASIFHETGVAFEVISADLEAQLTLQAVLARLHKLHITPHSFVMVDIGGASTELAFYFKSDVVVKSFPIGIVTMAQRFRDLDAIRDAMNNELQEINDFYKEIFQTYGQTEVFVATAGTPTTVAAMKLGLNSETYSADKINGTLLKYDELEFYLAKLLAMPFEEREYTVGTGRSELIQAGILIYKALFEILNFKTCIVVDDGLREGVALEWCRSMKKY
jgi:exopolyphosphatase/guanosine-5'-triphosphate,3'-diphosphate pyrophosphatase